MFRTPLTAVLLIVAVPAVAQDAPQRTAAFPFSMSGPPLDAWLRANTTIKPASVIAVGGGRVVAVVSKSPLPGSASLMRLTIRTELVSQEAAQEAKALSESNMLQIDCAARKAKAGETLQYAQRNMIGAMQVKPAWTDWAVAAPGTTLDRMVDAACTQKPKGLPAQLPAPPAPVLAPVKSPPPSAPPVTAPSGLAEPFATRAQLSSSTSEAAVQDALVQAKTRFAALIGERETSVRATEVEGQTYYRALIGGFSDAAEAAAFCAEIKTAGGDCVLYQQ